jgi:hypothetical protein
MKRCVVNVAAGGFHAGQERLYDALVAFDEETAFVSWRDEYPPNSPTHQEAPYAFKVFAVAEAYRQGFDSILWLDASCYLVKPIDQIWEYVEARGSAFWRCGFGLGEWATDESLHLLGRTRDGSMGTPLVAGGIWGVSMPHASASAFLERFLTLAEDGRVFRGPWDNQGGRASADPRCRGHRHDMIPMSHLVEEMQLPIINPPWGWAYDLDGVDVNPDTFILARGM